MNIIVSSLQLKLIKCYFNIQIPTHGSFLCTKASKIPKHFKNTSTHMARKIIMHIEAQDATALPV